MGVLYGLSKGNVEEGNDLDRIVNRVSNGYGLYMLDLN